MTELSGGCACGAKRFTEAVTDEQA